MTQAYFLNTITNVLGLSVKKQKVLPDDGYDTIFTIIHWKYDKIREWCTNKYKLITTRGGAYYGDQKIKCIQTLSLWANDLTLRGKKIDLSDFDATMMADIIHEARLDCEGGKHDLDNDKTDDFSQSRSVGWE